jgi:ABC-type sugar transport system substrate-binding protein
MHISRRLVLLMSILALSLPVLASCSQSPSGPAGKSDSSAGGKQKIAVIVSTLNNPWFVVLGDAAKGRADELGYESTIFDSKNDTAKEAEIFDSVITGGYKAIIFNPTDSKGSVDNVRKAKAAGIPVFCIDREIDATDAATSQMLSDSNSGCVELGQYFVNQVGKKGTYIELLGISGDNNTTIRSKGFHSVVDRYPDLKQVNVQNADFDRTKGMEVTESMLQKNPDIDAVFCGNDAMAMGAYQALVAAGKDKHVKVFGFDGADDVVKLIADGKITATVMQFPKKMARQAAEFADQWVKGKRDFQQKIPVGVELVTHDNVSHYENYGAKEDAGK